MLPRQAHKGRRRSASVGAAGNSLRELVNIRASQIAAAEREQTVSDFMLACFHAYMQSAEHA
jgi:hypothetical protein